MHITELPSRFTVLIDEDGALDSSVHVSSADQTDEQQEDKQTDSGVDDKHETTTEEVMLSGSILLKEYLWLLKPWTGSLPVNLPLFYL